MSLGAKLAGIDVQLVVEMDPYAANTYLHNFTPKLGLYRVDIREFERIDVDSKKEPTVVFGGPPCRGFSTSNQKNRDKGNSDNWLFQEFICVTRDYMPDWVVFENVRGILETEGGFFAGSSYKATRDSGLYNICSVVECNRLWCTTKKNTIFHYRVSSQCKVQFPEPCYIKKCYCKGSHFGLAFFN